MWSNILNTHPAIIRKKVMSWYEKQKPQTSLDYFSDKVEVEDDIK